MKIKLIGKLPPPVGGVTIHILRLFKWLKANDIAVEVLALNKPSGVELGVEGVGSISSWLLKRILFGFKEDIIHYHGANYPGLIFLVFVRLFHPNFKLYFTIHGEGYINRLKKRPIYIRLIKFCLGKLDCIFVGGNHLYEQLTEIGIDDANIHIVDAFLPPIVSDKKTIPASLLKVINSDAKIISANAYNVDKLANGGDLYGLYILSELAKRLNDNQVKFQMIILIANNNDEFYVSQLFDDIGNVHVVSDEKINGWEVISKSDLMIRPTSTDANAISMKEAMMFNVDVIASDVVPRYNGVVTFNYPNINDLVEKVEYSLDYGNPKIKVNNNIHEYIKLYKL